MNPPPDLKSWLDTLGLGQYADGFEAQAVSMETLAELTADDLKECGVAALGHRKALLAAIEALKSQPAGTSAPQEEETAVAQEIPIAQEIPVAQDVPVAFQGIPKPAFRFDAPAPHIPETRPLPVAHVERAAAPSVDYAAPAAVDHAPKPPEEKLPLLVRLKRAYFKASGSSLLLSIGIHAVILLIGTYLVVSRIVEDRKISFGGGEPGSKSEVQHKVKRKTTTAPAPNKRITTTSSVATVALPEMPTMQSNMGPTIAGAMGSGGFEAATGGLGGKGGGGGSGKGFSKITFFGLNGAKDTDGLVGTFYDLKQKPDGSPTSMELTDAEKASQNMDMKGAGGKYREYLETIKKFSKGWSKPQLEKFFKAPQKLVATQIVIPSMTAGTAPKEYGVEKECAPRRWAALYEGTIIPPRDGRFRFRGRGDDVILVRLNGQNVFDGSLANICAEVNTEAAKPGGSSFAAGKWLNLRKGMPLKMEVLIGECPGGSFYAILCLEEEGVQYPDGYPVFQLKAGAIPPCKSFPVGKEGMVFGVQGTKSGFGSLSR